MAKLEISLLGPFQVQLDGAPVTAFESVKVRALLAYLAAEADRSHSRESLATLLWPDLPQKSAMHNLRNALADLRKVIGDRGVQPHYLCIQRGSLQLDPEADVWVDVDQFKQTSRHIQQSAISNLQSAVSLYHGSFLDGFYLADSPAFEEWILGRREHHSRQVLQALSRLTEYEIEQGLYSQAEDHARRQIELEPWREQAHQQLMRTLSLRGERVQALAQFENLRKVLQSKLKAAPSQETIQLYEQIREGGIMAGDEIFGASAVNPTPNLTPESSKAGAPSLAGSPFQKDDILLENRDQLEQAIAALEAQRALLGNVVVEAAIGPMREKLAALDAQETPEQQRKVVSILFMDIAGHTRLIRNLDPEENMEIIDKALVRLTRPILEYGGHIARYQGDGFKAIFGLPVAQEDDPERAVRAGLAIQTVAREIAEELETERSMPSFQVRVGVDTGLVVSGGITEGKDTVKGIAVNLAARLESAAQPGSLLISHNTYRHIRGVFDVQPLDPIHAKGFEQPVPVYQVLRAKSRAFRMPTRGVEGVETRMIGRQAELGQLQEIFDLALREAETQVVTIVGDPGIGKSRLLYEFEQWVELRPEYVRIYHGRAMHDSSGTSFGLLHNLFAFRFNILESDPVDIVRGKLETGFSEFLHTEPVLKSHFIGSMLGYDFRTSPFIAGIGDDANQFYEEALFYLGQYLSAQAQQNLVLILLEDIHWADNASLDAVLKLARDQPRLRLMVVCLTRPVLFDNRPHWGQGETSHTRLDLKPLSRQSSRLLVNEILQKVRELPDALREQIVSNAEGNPFYVEELVKILIEDQVILKDEQEDIWRIDLRRLPELHIPVTLTAVLQARLDDLPKAEKVALQQAAVVGRIFWDAVIQVLQETEERPQPALDGLARRELIYPREISAFAGMKEFIIKHALLRDVVYQSVLKRTRRIYHRKTAEWLVEVTQSVGRVNEYAALIARHYEAANETQAAAKWYLQAGERAHSQSALREALNSLEKALILSSPEDRELRWKALFHKCCILDDLKEMEERQKALPALRELAQAIGDPKHLAKAYQLTGVFHENLGEYRQALSNYDAGLVAARQAANLPQEGILISLKILSLTYLGEIESATTLTKEALNITDSLTDENAQALVYTNLACFFTESGDLGRATNLIKQAAEIYRGKSKKVGEAVNCSNLGYSYVLLGLPDLSLPELTRSIELADSTGAKRYASFARLNLGLAHFRKNDPATARSILEELPPVFKSMDDKFGLGFTYLYLGLAYESIEDMRTTEKLYLQAQELMHAVQAASHVWDVQAGLARCALRQGKIQQALQYTDDLWDYLLKEGSKGMEFPIWAYLTCVRVFEAAGDPERCQMALETGYTDLVKRAEKISDLKWRDSFLNNIPEHSEIASWWQTTKAD